MNKMICLESKNISLKEAFKQIEQQTGYSIAYEQSVLDLDKKIDLSLNDIKLDEALDIILTEMEHTYKIRNYHIIVIPIKKEDNKLNNESTDNTYSSHNKLISYTGVALDKQTKDPLIYATVCLLDEQGLPAIVGVTDENGKFSLKAPVVSLAIRISYVGYEIIEQKIDKDASQLGVFFLTANEKTLDSFTVTGTTTNHLVDRNSYLVTAEMKNKASNAQELLDGIHGVRFDKISNSIKVGSETDVLLLVDGVRQSESYIKNLPPNRIHRIEVVTEPTGRYLSEGYAAIINFILQENYTGYDINIRNFAIANLTGNNGGTWFMNEQPGIGLTYTEDKVNIYANYTHAQSRWNEPVQRLQTYKGILEMTSDEVDTKNPNSLYKYQANSVNGGINYQISPEHIISFQTDYVFQKTNTYEHLKYRVKNLKNNTSGSIENEISNKSRDKDYVYTIFYKGAFSDKLSIYSDFTYNYYKDDVSNTYNLNNYLTENSYTESKKNYTKFNMESEYKITKKLQLSTGFANVWRRYEAKSVLGRELLDYMEFRNKLFAYLSYKINEKMSLKLGAGLEHIYSKDRNTNYMWTSSPLAKLKPKNSEWNIQPYFSWNYKVNDKLNINAGYATNIYYPTLAQLSPMYITMDSLMMQTGNPNLKSATRHTVSANITFWNRLTVRPIFKFTPKRISEVYEKTGYTGNNYFAPQYVLSYNNIDAKQYVLQAIYDEPLGEYFSMSHTLTYYYDKARYKDIGNSYHGLMLDSEINYFNSNLNLGATIGYYRSMDKSIKLQGYQMVNLDSWLVTLNKQFWNKKASLMVSYFPPLTWGVRQSQKREIDTPFYAETNSLSLKPYQNMLFVRFNLRFNNGKVNSTAKRSTTEKEERIKRNFDF